MMRRPASSIRQDSPCPLTDGSAERQPFRQPLLPALGLSDLWQDYAAVAYQPKGGIPLGGFGLSANVLEMGVNSWTDELGRTLGKARSWEAVYGFSWGTDLFDTKQHLLGVSVKYIYSALAPVDNSGKGTATGFAVDAGYLYNPGRYFRIGATLANMGPPVWYVSPENADPIPFTINLAFACMDSIKWRGRNLVDWAGEFRVDREFVKSYNDRRPDPFWLAVVTSLRDSTFEYQLSQINLNAGAELTFYNTFTVRMGWLFDLVGVRNEIKFGWGIRCLQVLQFDYYHIYSPEYMYVADMTGRSREGPTGVRDEQFGFSITLCSTPPFKGF